MAPSIQVLRIGALHSDGVHTNRPSAKRNCTPCDDYFRTHVAQRWAMDRKDIVDKTNVVIDRLPDGYAGFEKQRPNTEQIDRWMYGHPNGPFDSLKKFYKHFSHLVNTGSATDCTCNRCSSASARSQSSSRTKPSPAQPGDKALDITPTKKRKSGQSSDDGDELHDNIHVSKRPKVSFNANADEYSSAKRSSSDETTANLAAHPVKTVKNDSGLRVEHHQPRARYSVDPTKQRRSTCHRPFRAKQQLDGAHRPPSLYPDFFDEIALLEDDQTLDRALQQPKTWPLAGCDAEGYVRGCADLPLHHPRVGELVLYAVDNTDADSQPQWQAGITLRQQQTSYASSQSSFSISIQAFDDEDSTLSIPLTKTRPLQYWRLLMPDAQVTDLPPSVRKALESTSSVSPLLPYRLKAFVDDQGSNGTVYCRGVYLGSELILVGDMVRLLPINALSGTATNVMHITRLKFKLSIDKLGYKSTCLHFVGRGYTKDPSQSHGGYARHPVDSPVLSSVDNVQWYHVIDPDRPGLRMEVPFKLVVGRCFGHQATRSWLDVDSIGMKTEIADEQILKGLSAAAKHSAARQNSVWRWCKSRSHQLWT